MHKLLTIFLMPLLSVMTVAAQYVSAPDTFLFETFGGGQAITEMPIRQTTVPGINNNRYTQVFSFSELNCDRTNDFQPEYIIAKKVQKEGLGWYQQVDHTNPGRGYMLVVDDDAANGVCLFQSEPFSVATGDKIVFGAWLANPKTYYANSGSTVQIPSIELLLTVPSSSNISPIAGLTRVMTYDSALPTEEDCQSSSQWHHVTQEFIVPYGVSLVQLVLRATPHSEHWGNDYCVDDIYLLRYRKADDSSFCVHGDTLFFDDFGGNNRHDPEVSQSPLPYISNAYQQVLSNAYGSMVPGGYLVTKYGYHNGPPTYSQWLLMSDHTHPRDSTRGYFLQVDGIGRGEKLYEANVNNLQPGSTVSFSAFVANVVNYTTRDAATYSSPNFTFSIEDLSGNVLSRANSGDIPLDKSAATFFRSPEWHHVGMEFTVPDGVTSCVLRIYDNGGHNPGNDFAMDDICLIQCGPEYEHIYLSDCDSVPYEGQYFYQSTLLEVEKDGVNYRVHITVNPSVHQAVTLIGEDEYTYEGETFYNDTTLIRYSTTAAGCEKVDTIHVHVLHTPIEYLDNLIVNELNWLVVCNNRLLHAKYPADSYVYHWQKDGQSAQSVYPYPDYYTEDQELNGVFQLEVLVQRSIEGNVRVRSNILTISPRRNAPMLSPNPALEGQQVKVVADGSFALKVYDPAGLLIYQTEADNDTVLPAFPSGLYVIQILQDAESITQKLIVR